LTVEAETLGGLLKAAMEEAPERLRHNLGVLGGADIVLQYESEGALTSRRACRVLAKGRRPPR